MILLSIYAFIKLLSHFKIIFGFPYSFALFLSGLHEGLQPHNTLHGWVSRCIYHNLNWLNFHSEKEEQKNCCMVERTGITTWADIYQTGTVIFNEI